MENLNLNNAVIRQRYERALAEVEAEVMQAAREAARKAEADRLRAERDSKIEQLWQSRKGGLRDKNAIWKQYEAQIKRLPLPEVDPASVEFDRGTLEFLAAGRIGCGPLAILYRQVMGRIHDQGDWRLTDYVKVCFRMAGLNPNRVNLDQREDTGKIAAHQKP